MDMDTGERVYGGCEGPEAMYVKLISSDGHEFIVKREHALTSGTIKASTNQKIAFLVTFLNDLIRSLYYTSHGFIDQSSH